MPINVCWLKRAAEILRPHAIALWQGAVLAAVLLGAKEFVPSNPVVSLAVLLVVGGVVCLALNAQEVLAVWRNRTLRAAFSREGR